MSRALPPRRRANVTWGVYLRPSAGRPVRWRMRLVLGLKVHQGPRRFDLGHDGVVLARA